MLGTADGKVAQASPPRSPRSCQDSPRSSRNSPRSAHSSRKPETPETQSVLTREVIHQRAKDRVKKAEARAKAEAQLRGGRGGAQDPPERKIQLNVDARGGPNSVPVRHVRSSVRRR